MILWCVFFCFLFFSGRRALADLPARIRNSQGVGIRIAEGLFHELEETLASGLVPSDSRWLRLKTLEAPWNRLSYDCLSQLRSEGAAVVPTLKRFRELARKHFESLNEARARSAQALAQAAVCGSMAPFFAFLLRVLLPEVEAAGIVWWFATGAAAVLGLLSGFWIWKMAESARWGGLAVSEQSWMLDGLVFGERLLALLRLGRSPDRAWTESIVLLPAELLASWGADPWNPPRAEKKPVIGGSAANLREALLRSGAAYKKAIQASLWDGQPCAERIESVIDGLRAETRSFQERELQMLPTRALKPLFLLTAPGLLALLGFALFLSVAAAVGEF